MNIRLTSNNYTRLRHILQGYFDLIIDRIRLSPPDEFGLV